MKYVIRLKASHDSWVANHNTGDPPRTRLIENARVFETKNWAKKTAQALRKKYPNRGYKVEVLTPQNTNK